MIDINNIKITFHDLARFWKKVDMQDHKSCWIWKDKRGNRSPTGIGSTHGTFTINGRNYGAHRISYLINCGNIPNGLCICHHCDNPPCVNPSHLFLGTYSDNMKDSIKKGRREMIKSYRNDLLRKSNYILGKITIIEYHRRKHGWSRATLADRAGINRSTIFGIESGRNKTPSTRTLIKIANALGVKITELWGTVEAHHE